MDKKFLNKVVDQIVRETIIDYGEETVFLPFINHPKPYHVPLSYFYHYKYPSERPTINTWFIDHCRDIYGLTEQEIVYSWREYVDIIKNKIRN